MRTDWYRRHHDDEVIDRVSIDCVPRFKVSGLSGDEWRVSYVLRLYRKGGLLVERGFNRIDDAVAALPWVLRTWAEGGDDEAEARWSAHLKIEEELCHQVGCGSRATVVVRLKRLTSSDGRYLATEEMGSWRHLRAFCAEHANRGDCGREDCDENHEIVSGEIRPYTGEVSPSSVVVIGGE